MGPAVAIVVIALIFLATLRVARWLEVRPPKRTMAVLVAPIMLSMLGNQGLAGCFFDQNTQHYVNPDCERATDPGCDIYWPLHPVPDPEHTYPLFTNPLDDANALNNELCALGVLSTGGGAIVTWANWDSSGSDGTKVGLWFAGIGAVTTFQGCLQTFSVWQSNFWLPYYCGTAVIHWALMHSLAQMTDFFNNYGCDLLAGGVAYDPR